MNNNYLRLHYTMKPPQVCFNTRVGITTTLLVLLILCFNVKAQPVINSIWPAKGDIGSNVIINGANFSSSVDSNVVYFGPVRSTVISASSNQLTVEVPYGASSLSTIQVTNLLDNLHSSSINATNSLPYFNVTFHSRKIDLGSYSNEDVITTDNPRDIGVGDFNGDGKPDIVVANPLYNYFSIYYRNSDNTGFESPALLGYDTYLFPTPGDFNGDGKTDIALTNPASGLISVFLRNEDNSDFDGPFEYAVGSNPQKLATGDFNGDGRMDIACTNYASQNISILYWNTEYQDFDEAVTLACASQPSCIIAADFNKDGKTDLATTSYGANSLSVFIRNEENTGFSAPLIISGISQPKSLVAADFNGDEQLDIATANYGSNNISLFLRNAGNTGFDSALTYGTGSGPSYITAADFNGDGKVDLASVNFNSHTLSMFIRHPSNNSFRARLDLPTGNFPNFLAVGDFNVDGRVDIAVNLNSTKVILMTNNSLTGIVEDVLSSTLRLATNEFPVASSSNIVFPNPFNEYLSFLIKTNTEENVDVQVQDIHGKTILSGKYKSNRINTIRENLSAGQYILIANYSNISKAFRVYKVH